MGARGAQVTVTAWENHSALSSSFWKFEIYN